MNTAGGGAPARRAVARWAWRLFRREWRQQLLILGLLMVAVAMTTFGLGLVTNISQSQSATLGTADTDLTFTAATGTVGGDVAQVARTFGAVEEITHASIAVPGSLTTVDLRAQDPKGMFGHKMVALLHGQLPSGTDQIAVTPHVATLFDLRIGSVWRENGQSRTVVGVIENPENFHDAFALVAPGQTLVGASASAFTPVNVQLLFNANGRDVSQFSLPGVSAVGIAQYSKGTHSAQVLIVLIFATIAMMFVGLLAVAGFTVLAHRRLRALGMLGAIGASDRHIRLVMLANGAAVGMLGAALGAIVGIVAWITLAPELSGPAAHRIDRFALPWAGVGGAVGIAVATAVIAAWWPARAMARIPVVTALSGRPPRPKRARTLVAAGAVLLAAGITAIRLGAPPARTPFAVLSGIVLSTLGLLFLAPAGIGLAGRLGARSPVAVRLALRDLVRYRSRSGAALAAITLAIAIAATITVSATGAEASARKPADQGNLAANQVELLLNGDSGNVTIPSASALATAQQRVEALAGTLHATATVPMVLATTTFSQPGGPGGGSVQAKPSGGGSEHVRDAASGTASAALVTVQTSGNMVAEMLATTLYEATPALLAYYRIPAATLQPDAGVLVGQRSLTADQVNVGPNITAKATFQVLAQLPAYSDAPDSLITPGEMSALKLTPAPGGWLLQTAKPLTSAQITIATHAAAAAGLTVDSRPGPDEGIVELAVGSTAFGVLAALGVLAMTVGLIRSETAPDLRTLTAAGAGAQIRRVLTGATAGTLGLLGGLMGIAAAYGDLAAWHHAHLTSLQHVPYADLAVILVGLPLLATAAGAALAGREPAGLGARPLG